jgi:poly(3-hydroxybutyrate) depolymerase
LKQPRHPLAVAWLLALCLCWASETVADHDKVPFPPPSSMSQTLQAVPSVAADAITVSGLSSGAFFAHQFHIAHSKLVAGAGLIAGGPYGCVENIPNPFYWFATVPLRRGLIWSTRL